MSDGVGITVAHDPLHRSGRAALPHPAPALGHGVKLTHSPQRAEHAGPAQSPGRVTLGQVSLGQPPSLHRLRSRSRGLVRRLHRYYRAVRLPASVHHRRASSDFPMRSAIPSTADRNGISRFPCEVFPPMPGVSGRAKLPRVSRYRRGGCSLPLPAKASAPRSISAISRLNAQPERTPVNASPWPLRTTTHDSGPEWVATPSPYGSFIHNTSPVSPAHSRVLKNLRSPFDKPAQGERSRP